ncbi:flavodoxin domain-containing protein [Gymnodinialimonas hymeniacidonis]|uniref:flavodoxin domain-containing protein n=1 Tax=Gymnodinialimonas hymeniacidonis TaxID=3126508 RepID=UPI0034C60E75
MKYLIAYASTHGQTRRIARHAMDRLHDIGHSVELLPLIEAEGLDPRRFDGVILAGSLHAGHYQPAMTEFASLHADRLNTMPTLFLAVSLAAAGHDTDDWRGLDTALHDLTEATSWHPGHVTHVAGAYKPSAYDIVTRLIMRRIIAKKDPGTDLSADHDFTDWPALDAALEGWLEQA